MSDRNSAAGELLGAFGPADGMSFERWDDDDLDQYFSDLLFAVEALALYAANWFDGDIGIAARCLTEHAKFDQDARR